MAEPPRISVKYVEWWNFYCYRCEQWCQRRGPWCDLYLSEPRTSECFFEINPHLRDGLAISEDDPHVM